MSFRDQIVAVLAARPGISAAYVKEALEELGVKVAKNEPAGTLNVLKGQGRVRHEGDWPARIYFAVEGAPAPAKGGSKPKAERTAPKPRKTDAELDPHNVRAIPASRPATLASAEDIVRAELANTILGHLQDDDNWDTAEQIAIDLAESRQKVSLAIADLMRAGRVTRKADVTGRWVYRDKREGDEVQAAHGNATAQDAAPRTQPAEQVALSGNSAAESCVPAPEASAVAHGASVSLGDVLSRMKKALQDPEPVNLPYAIGLEIAALEDLMGDACDAQAPHSAIKALVVASSSLRRAVAALQPRQP